jgi:hypothetical protein
MGERAEQARERARPARRPSRLASFKTPGVQPPLALQIDAAFIRSPATLLTHALAHARSCEPWFAFHRSPRRPWLPLSAFLCRDADE